MGAEQHGLDVKEILALAHGRRSIETMRLVAPENCLVFEDAPSGIAAGLVVGMRVIAIATTYPVGELPKTVQAIQILADVQVEVMKASSEKRSHPELVLTIGV